VSILYLQISPRSNHDSQSIIILPPLSRWCSTAGQCVDLAIFNFFNSVSIVTLEIGHFLGSHSCKCLPHSTIPNSPVLDFTVFNSFQNAVVVAKTCTSICLCSYLTLLSSRLHSFISLFAAVLDKARKTDSITVRLIFSMLFISSFVSTISTSIQQVCAWFHFDQCNQLGFS
jgi:hypothetical protein